MEVKCHDLLRITGSRDLITESPLPEWASASLLEAPFVVVCRSGHRNEHIAVGIRGNERSMRMAAWLSAADVKEVISPWSVTATEGWNVIADPPPAIDTLSRIFPIMQQSGYRWGPTGSAAFELVTARPTLKSTSDLDLLIDIPEAIAANEARALLKSLEAAATVYVDVQMNTPAGGVALREYISSASCLVKTCDGPFILHGRNLWNGGQNICQHQKITMYVSG